MKKGNTVLTNILAVNIYSENRPVTLAKQKGLEMLYLLSRGLSHLLYFYTTTQKYPNAYFFLVHIY